MNITSKLYRTYLNEFISISGFAEHYNLTKEQALSIINRAKVLHQREVLLKGAELSPIVDYNRYSIGNRGFFKCRDDQSLLSEFSA